MAEAQLRVGTANWLHGYRNMLRFDVAASRGWLPIAVGLQILLGTGMAIIYGIYLPRVPPRSAAFIVTGAPAVAFVLVGFVLVPGIVSQQKTAGIYDFIWSLPVPRSASVASTLTVFSLAAVPGALITVALSAWRYHVALSPTPLLLGAIVLVTLMASSVGYAMAHAIANPVVTNVITNALILVVLLFAPIAFPPSHYPAWLVHAHEYLPVYPMAVVIRAALLPGLVTHVARAYVVLIAWTILGWAIAAWIVGRRH
jgi:ABC-2 type transport system permease protein